MKIISELIESTKVQIEEGKDGSPKSYFITGPFLQAVHENRNKRVYPLETMAKEVKQYTENYIDKKRAFGELGHPENPSINLDRVSHMILSLEQDGNYWNGKAKILDTPMGKIVKSLIDEGANLGVSSRGMGSLKESNGIKVVQPDFTLSTAADIVSDPSSQKAWVQGIMENKEWAYNPMTESWIVVESIKEEIKKISAKQVALNQAKYFQSFLNSIK